MREGDLPFGARVSMEPAGYDVEYVSEGSGVEYAVRQEPFASYDGAGVGIAVDFDGEVLEVAVTPAEPVRIGAVRIRLRHAFAGDELVLLNGYQSWTDTAERPAWARMRGLGGVPRRVVEGYAIDGGGDYGFADYTAKRGEQHGFTYATFRRGEGMVLVASLDESRGFTLIRTSAGSGQVALEPECPRRVLAAGQRVVVGRWAIVRGTLDECYGRWAELAAWRMRPAKPIVGYTSWYRHYGDIDAAKLAADLESAEAFFGREPLPSLDGACKLFQVDDGYCKVGDWLHVDRAKFPEGLASIARHARDAGFTPGLWCAPFACERDSRLYRERPEWLLRDERGDEVRTGPQWSGGVALDTLNVEVRSYVLDVLSTMTREWGFGLLKLDFLYAACMRPHGGLNRGELMADALGLIRTAVGDGVAVLGCGVPLGSAFGRVEYCRIGCDVGLDWDDVPHMRLLHRERVSTKNSLANTHGRAPLDGRAFGNDPDVFFLRGGVKLTEARRDELLRADAGSGSVLLTSDDMGAWLPEMRQRYRQALETFLDKRW